MDSTRFLGMLFLALAFTTFMASVKGFWWGLWFGLPAAIIWFWALQISNRTERLINERRRHDRARTGRKRRR